MLALHGMTLTEAFEEYMDELVYRGGVFDSFYF